MANLKTFVELALGGNYNREIEKANASTGKFAKSAESGLGKLKAAQAKIAEGFSKIARSADAIAGPLGTLAAGLSLGAASKQLIDFDAQVTALGVQAKMSDAEIAVFKRDIFSAATNTNIKMPVDELAAAAATITDLTGDAYYAQNNLYAIGLAMRGIGASGNSMGAMFSLFKQWNIDGEDLNNTLATMMAIADNGAFTASDMANLGSRVFPTILSSGREATKAIIESAQAMELIRPVSGSAEMAVTSFQALARNIKNPSKQLQKSGIDLDLSTRSIVDIMADLVTASKGNVASLGMDAEATAALALLQTEYKQSVDGTMPSLAKYKSITADIGYVEEAAARKAKTMQANLDNLKTNVLAGFGSALTPALEKLNEALNKLSENPEELQRAFTVIAVGLGSIVAIKGIASVANSVQTLAGIWGKGGGAKLNITQSLVPAGAQGLPVFVTNLGAGGLGSGGLGGGSGRQAFDNLFAPKPPKAPAAPAVKPNIANRALSGVRKAVPMLGGTAIVSGVWNGIDAFGTISEIEKSDASDREKTIQKGQAVGKAVGKTGGVIAGMALGAAVGSVVPVIGTAIGGLGGAIVGALLAQVGSDALGAGGEYLGGKLAEAAFREKEKTPPVVTEELLYAGRGNQYVNAMLMDLKASQANPPKAELEGSADVRFSFSFPGMTSGQAAQVQAQVSNNDTPFKFQTGNRDMAVR